MPGALRGPALVTVTRGDAGLLLVVTYLARKARMGKLGWLRIRPSSIVQKPTLQQDLPREGYGGSEQPAPLGNDLVTPPSRLPHLALPLALLRLGSLPRKAVIAFVLGAVLALFLWLGAMETMPWRTPFPMSLCPWIGYCM